MQFDPDMSDSVAHAKATELYKRTKGEKVRIVNHNQSSTATTTKNNNYINKKTSSSSSTHYWRGGSETCTFNVLEAISNQPHPRTPALDCEIPDGLKLKNLSDPTDFLTSRINWTVQSSGVDYLHLLLVAMKHLAKVLRIDMRFAISIHDEVRYLVRREHRYKAAFALQIANLWTRALFVHRVGMVDLPLVRKKKREEEEERR